jgi:hypothetical protein
LNSDGITRRGMMRGSSRPVITCDCMQSTFFLVTPWGNSASRLPVCCFFSYLHTLLTCIFLCTGVTEIYAIP